MIRYWVNSKSIEIDKFLMKPQMQGIVQHSRLLFKGLLLFLLIGIWSCDQNEKIGLEITPPGERFAYHQDTASVIRVSTLRQDSLTSEKRSRSLLGSMNDPVFGKSRAGILTQLRLSSNDVDFGENVQLDSVVLLLKYQSGIGDTTDLQHIRVYELLEDLYFDSTYYSNLDISSYFDEANPVADFQYYPTPRADSLFIRIDDIIGEKILFADTSYLKDNASFLDYFKGLYFESSAINEEGSVMYFDLTGGDSRMMLYYNNSEEDSLKYEVVINSNCTWLNVFEHDYTGSEIELIVNDSMGEYGRAYIQAMAGLRAYARIEFSDTLMQLSYDGISINKAELRIPVAQEYVTNEMLVPGNIQIFNALEDGTNEFISDIFLGEEYHGGFYDESTGEYTFNIAKYVQDLLDVDLDFRVKNNGMFIVIKDSRISGNHLVINNNPQGEKIRLNITYTVIN